MKPDNFPRTPVHSFGETLSGTPLDHVPVNRKRRRADILFFLSLATLSLLPLAYAALLLFLLWSDR